MMEPVHRIDGSAACAVSGRVRLDPAKALWNGVMIAGTLAAPHSMSPGAVIVFVVGLYTTLLLGHSVGMHRLMIHRSYSAHPALEAVLIWLGVLAGFGGPKQVIGIHDMRDWAQRVPDCHDYFSHRTGYLRDMVWQLFCRFEFDHPPHMDIEPEWTERPVMAHFNKYWRWHQIALGGLLLAIGGLPWLLWGICVRVLLSTVGHWSVTHFCHSPASEPHGRYEVLGAGVQASDLPVSRAHALAGWMTHGECWHSNHHAFPESARVGLEPGQVDPAGWVIERLERLGWVWDVRGPRAKDEREDLVEIGEASTPVPGLVPGPPSSSWRRLGDTPVTENPSGRPRV